ncbi:MAG: homoserine O-acetyltransferase [Pseudomonadota bacterium]
MTSVADRQRSLLSPDTRYFESKDALELESGAVLPGLTLAYRTWGRLDPAAPDAVLICHALTGSADADDWWPGMIGDGLALDPARDFIVCSNVIGGCYGSSGPLTTAAGGDRRYGGDFPQVTVRDMVQAQRRLLDALGVRRLKLVVGPSLGGMQVLEWAATFPERVESIAPIGVSGRHSAWCIGISAAQREAIYNDPAWQGGHYSDASPPAQGLAAARMMAMVSYRSFDNLAERFGRGREDSGEFSVESYLRYQGAKLNGRFDAVSYVRLTEAMDSHDVARGRGDYPAVLGTIAQPALVVSVSSDVLYPPREQRELAEALPNADYRVLESPHGHDGFLIDTAELGFMIKDFRSKLKVASSSRIAVAN